MRDPYRTLNVSRTADGAAIKAAYRRLAKELHPDRNPGDRQAEQRFKEACQAYELLSDPEKRTAFDRGLIDAEGRPRNPFNFGAGGRAGAGDHRTRTGFESIFEKAFGFGRSSGGEADNAFEELLRGRQRQGGGPRAVRGADIRHKLEVDFLIAARGGRERVLLRSGRSLEVDVPAGTADGAVLRLRGQGHASPTGGPAGDALIEIEVRSHPQFQRKGHDIHVELPISLPEAILGGRVKVPTIDGTVRVTVAEGSNTGQTLRLRGKGLPFPDGTRGDQYVRLVVVLPERQDPEMAAWLRRWAKQHAYDVRGDLETT